MSDFDGEDYGCEEEYSIVTNLIMPRCQSFVQVYYPSKNYENEQELPQKIKHQIKSGKYYIFWGAATIAVMAGQIYVGNGYRTMSESIRDLNEMIEIKFEYDLLKDSRRKCQLYNDNKSHFQR